MSRNENFLHLPADTYEAISRMAVKHKQLGRLRWIVMKGSKDATAWFHLGLLYLFREFFDDGGAVGGALALLHAEDRPVAPGQNGGDGDDEIVMVFRPGNNVGAALRIAKLGRRCENVYASRPQFLHRFS